MLSNSYIKTPKFPFPPPSANWPWSDFFHMPLMEIDSSEFFVVFFSHWDTEMREKGRQQGSSSSGTGQRCQNSSLIWEGEFLPSGVLWQSRESETATQNRKSVYPVYDTISQICEGSVFLYPCVIRILYCVESCPRFASDICECVQCPGSLSICWYKSQQKTLVFLESDWEKGFLPTFRMCVCLCLSLWVFLPSFWALVTKRGKTKKKEKKTFFSRSTLKAKMSLRMVKTIKPKRQTNLFQ